MSEIKSCPFCGSTAVVKCRVDSDWGVDLRYRLLNDESNYDIKSMIADENYDSNERSGDYWDIEIFRCQSCRAEWGGGTDVCVAALNARIAELEKKVDSVVKKAVTFENKNRNLQKVIAKQQVKIQRQAENITTLLHLYTSGKRSKSHKKLREKYRLLKASFNEWKRG